MKEKSQIEAMRAAIRGDLERSRARQDAVPAVEPEPEDVPEQPAEDKPRPGIFSSFFKRAR
jgi:hypothetical protein